MNEKVMNIIKVGKAIITTVAGGIIFLFFAMIFLDYIFESKLGKDNYEYLKQQYKESKNVSSK